MNLDLPDLAGALCAQVDPELWFPPSGVHPFAAKRICRRCPVVEPCLQYALDNPVEGVWGGTSVRDRMRLARAQGRSYNTVLTAPGAGPSGRFGGVA